MQRGTFCVVYVMLGCSVSLHFSGSRKVSDVSSDDTLDLREGFIVRIIVWLTSSYFVQFVQNPPEIT